MEKIKMYEDKGTNLLKRNDSGDKTPIGRIPFGIIDFVDEFDFDDIEKEINKKLTVSGEYITTDIDYKYYQDRLDEILSNANTDREKAVAAAIFLATEFPKLPYFWGGGHELRPEDFMGINNDWGTMQAIEFGLDDYYVEGEYFPYSYDCSAFVSWCLVNAGYQLDECLNTTTCSDLGKHVSITDSSVLDKANVGDLGIMKGHVGIIVDINKETKEISFAHISGSGYGMGITTISTETGKITKDEIGVIPEKDKYGNTIEPVSRIGNNYFEEIVLVPYKD